MINLQKGQKISLGLEKVNVGLGWDPNDGSGAEFDLDASAFLQVNKQQRSAQTAHGFAALIFFHPDYTVGPGVSPGQRTPKRPVADCTASGELRPALKTKYSVLFLGIVYDSPKENATPNFDFLRLSKAEQKCYHRTNETGQEARHGPRNSAL